MVKPSIDHTLAALAEDFAFLSDWEERYAHVIDLGKALAPLGDHERTDLTKVRGCASQVWLVTERAPGAPLRLCFRGDSDAHIVRGLIAILLQVYSGRTPEDILSIDAPALMQALGLTEALSAQRANGLHAMVQRIREAAQSALPHSCS